METLTQLLSFVGALQNLPYTLMLAACIVLALAQLSGLGGEVEDGDLSNDMDAASAEAPSVDAEGEGDADDAVQAPWLAQIGVGKVPLAVLLLLLFASTGLLGLTLNAIVSALVGGFPPWVFPITLALALGLGLVATSQLARAVGRVLPPLVSTATDAASLVGRRGVVTTALHAGALGTVRVRDAGGTMISVFARAQTDIPRDAIVVLAHYDPQANVYIAAPL